MKWCLLSYISHVSWAPCIKIHALTIFFQNVKIYPIQWDVVSWKLVSNKLLCICDIFLVNLLCEICQKNSSLCEIWSWRGPWKVLSLYPSEYDGGTMWISGLKESSSHFLSYDHPPEQIDGLMQERCNSSALAVELHLSCINPSKCGDRIT